MSLSLGKKLLVAGAVALAAAACADFDGYRLRETTGVDHDGTSPPGDFDGDDGPPSDGAGVSGEAEPRRPDGSPDRGSDSGSNSEGGGTTGPQPGDVTCYRDADGDSFPAASGAKVFNPSCPAGWMPTRADGKVDCDDDNADARPGQSAYFIDPRAGGTFDYDCDGIQAKNLPYVVDCSSVTAGDCQQALYVFRVNGVRPNTAADIKCGDAVSSYKCKLLATGACVVNESSFVGRNVACK